MSAVHRACYPQRNSKQDCWLGGSLHVQGPKPQNNYLGEIMRMMMVFIYMKGCCVADVDGIKFSFLMLNFAESSSEYS